MMSAAELSRAILVRHKEPGHLRFDLPPRLADAAAQAHLETGLRQQPGVYRVAFEAAGRRLAIHFDPGLCGFGEVGKQLRGLLDTLPSPAPAGAAVVAPSPLPGAKLFADAGRWAERFVGGSIKSRLDPIMQGALTEQATINFLNDVLMFYLVKVHWDLITKRWMKEPLKHADAWLTTFYLIFLLVRYRKSRAATTAAVTSATAATDTAADTPANAAP